MEQYLQDYYDKHAKSVALYEQAKQRLPLGVTSSIRAFKPFPFFVDHDGGSRVWDVDGNEYIDCQLAYGPLLVGHRHPVLTEAIRDQLDKGVIYSMPHILEMEAADLLRERFPCMEKVRYSCSGTEATMHAMRLARAYTGREKIVKVEGCYHGANDYGLWSTAPDVSKAGPADAPIPVCASRGIPACVGDTMLIVPFNDAEALQKVVDEHPNEIAGFILEPIMGNSSVILPEPGYLQKVRDITAKAGIVLIYDEVITGCRVAYGGAGEWSGVTPDMITLSKAVGGGYPVSVIGGLKDIMECIEHGTTHAGTFGGNPLCMRAIKTTLGDILTRETTDELIKKSDQAFSEIEALLNKSGLPITLQHVGAMGGILFGKKEKARNYRDTFGLDEDLWSKFFIRMLNNGVIMETGDPTETIFFSVQHTDDDYAKILKAVEKTINDM